MKTQPSNRIHCATVLRILAGRYQDLGWALTGKYRVDSDMRLYPVLRWHW